MMSMGVCREVAQSTGFGCARERRVLLRPFMWLAMVLLGCCGASASFALQPEVYESGGYQYTIAPPPAWIARHDIPARWDAAQPLGEMRWRNWLFDMQIDHRHGARVRYYDRAYEPVSGELVQEAGKYQIWFSPDHQKLTIHRVEVRRDGVWSNRLSPKAVTLARRESDFEHDMANGMVSALIVLDDVRAGDIVRVSYTIEGDNPVLAGLVGEDFVYAWVDPILDRYARVLFDPKAKLIEHRDAGAPKSTQRSSGDALEWTADEHMVAGFIDEGSYPPWYDAAPATSVSESRTWADVAAWARALYPAPKALPADLEERIETWKKLSDPMQRLIAALKAVQEEVRYFGVEMGQSTHKPAEPAETWGRRYGDCKDKARLLATVLTRLDIEAHPALVSYERGKAVADLPPAASLFDHVIVMARLQDATIWLDATLTQQRGSPLGRAPGNFGVALPVANGVHDLVKVTMPEAAIDRLKVVEHLLPNASEKGVALEIDSEYAGAAADRMRRRIKVTGSEKLGREFLEYYRRRYGNVEATSAFAVSDDESGNLLKVNERYLLKDPWVGPAVGKRSLDLYADALSSSLTLPKTATRTAPLRIEYPLEMEQKSYVNLPEGWRWIGEPAQRKLENEAIDYEAKMEQSGRVVSVTQRLRTRRDVVEPGEYPKHFALLREANDLLGRRVALALPEKASERERDQRLESLMRNILDDGQERKQRGN
ncbi:DUF3857 domain-containing protein [Rudaea sp.]|uniref:DUF3857 domain-containing protein n=1 Tax=Rudaea sp. TaxID=2136325 RepID=UPI002ED35661